MRRSSWHVVMAIPLVVGCASARRSGLEAPLQSAAPARPPAAAEAAGPPANPVAVPEESASATAPPAMPGPPPPAAVLSPEVTTPTPAPSTAVPEERPSAPAPRATKGPPPPTPVVAPQAAKPATPSPAAAPAERVSAPTPPANGAAAPTTPAPVLSLEVGDEAGLTREINTRLGRAESVIERINPAQLNKDHQQMFASIQDYVSKARDALTNKDLPRAGVLSEKASTLAAELAAATR